MSNHPTSDVELYANLPAEIFHHHIFKYLNNRPLRRVIRRVCKNFNEWVEKNVKVATLDFGVNNANTFYECSRLGAFRNVEKIILKNCESKLMDLFAYQDKEWICLKNVTISGYLNSSDFNALYKFTDFESLSLTGAGGDWTSYRKIAQYSNLKSLKMIGCGYRGPYSDWWFTFLATPKPYLKVLDTSDCELDWLDLNFIGSISSLESLNLKTFTNWKELTPLTKWNMPNLTFLNISGYSISPIVPDICKLFNLRSFKMADCRVSDGKDWKLFAETIFPNLTFLDISKNSLSVEYLKSMTKLTYLNITECGITDDSVKKLFSGILSKNLETLDISENSISDLGVTHISLSENSSSLRSITCIPKDKCLTSISVKDIVNSPYLENLTLLNLSGNAIDSTGLEYLAESNLQKLKILKLCRNSISELDMINFMKGKIRNLTEIDFSPSIVSQSKFKVAFPSLKILNRKPIKR